MRTKIILFLLVTIFAIGALVGCTKKVESGKGTPKVINIGTQQMPNDENIAKAKGYFNELGVTVNLLEFDSGSAVVNALVSGGIDLGLIGTTPATTAIANNIEIELIWIHGILGKSEALAVKNSANVGSVSQLKGKTIATPFGSTGHYSLLSALKLNGIHAADVKILDMQPKDIYAAWQRGDIDAAYVWDPILGNLLADGKILTTSEDLARQGVITADTEVVSKKFGEKYPEVVAAYIKALSKAQDDYRNDFNGVVSTLSKYFQISQEDSKKQILGNVWLSAKEQLAKEYLGTRDVPGELSIALKKTADFLVEQKSITKAPDLSVFQKAINSHYIELALNDDGQKATLAKTILRIGAQPYPLYSSIYVARKLGYLEEELAKVNATYTWTEFNAGPLVNEAVASGNADIGFMADMPAILAKSSGQDIQIFANIAYGEKALALLVKKDSPINDISQLKGKKIAYVKGSYAQHLTALLLEKAGLTFNDIISVNLGAGDIPAALESGQIDGTVIWEQFVSQLVLDGKAKVIADGTGIKKGNMVSYVVKSYAEANPKVIAAYIKAGQRASDYIKSNPKQAAEAVAGDFKITPLLLEEIFKNLIFYQAFTSDDIKEIEKVKNYILAEKIIRNDVKIDELVTTKYIKEAGL